ncbi:DUF7446 family protein [Erwinia mallotivora]|uniref:DUF7446 family protein n=1 Tax=Erwinia mallotivora TaxID=69222 RepID=UPI0021C1E3E0|nr:hypothetical protein [Erwinia mallotivora]
MHNENLEYRVAYTPLSGRLYAGLVRQDNGKWEGQPHDVTDWAMLAVGLKLSREGNDILFPLQDGRCIRISAFYCGAEGAEVPDERL